MKKWSVFLFLTIQFSSVAQSCPIFCDPMDCSKPGFHLHHQLPELAQTHVHWVGDAIQPSHPLSSPSPPAFSLFQHQGLLPLKNQKKTAKLLIWVNPPSKAKHVAAVDLLSFSEVFIVLSVQWCHCWSFLLMATDVHYKSHSSLYVESVCNAGNLGSIPGLGRSPV